MPFHNANKGNWIRLSHILDEQTPAYGNGEGFEVKKVRDLQCGDSCNASFLTFSNHLGSHVDAPLHFVDGGKAIADYEISDWIFTNPQIIDLPTKAGVIITPESFGNLLEKNTETDFLLIRTGFEQQRMQDAYWDDSPAYAPELAEYFLNYYPSLKAIGLDTLSIGSPNHRPLGHAVHKAFLGKDLRIFEDLALADVPSDGSLTTVMAFPMLFQNADGAPCTIIGQIMN